MTTYSKDCPAHFIADHERILAALEPWVLTHPKGFLYLSHEAPDALVQTFNRLEQHGYAIGAFG